MSSLQQTNVRVQGSKEPLEKEGRLFVLLDVYSLTVGIVLFAEFIRMAITLRMYGSSLSGKFPGLRLEISQGSPS